MMSLKVITHFAMEEYWDEAYKQKLGFNLMFVLWQAVMYLPMYAR